MNLEGKKAPEFDLEGSDGKRHMLQDYKGKTVVLYFTLRTIRRAARKKPAASAISTRRRKKRAPSFWASARTASSRMRNFAMATSSIIRCSQTPKRRRCAPTVRGARR